MTETWPHRVTNNVNEAKIYNHQSIADATAIILAGGKSSRMGKPKALLEFSGEPLIVHLVRTLKNIFAETVIVAAPEQELPPVTARVVRDEVPHQGPVGGICYGLRTAVGEFAFVTSCDVPFLNRSVIAYLLSQISEHDVVVPYWQGRFQPLHAVYRKSVLPFLEAQLERGELRPVYLFDKVRTYKIGEDKIRRFDPEGLSFLNMNTPEEYGEALKRWKELSHSCDAAPNHSVQCTVELFGVARLLAKTQEVALSLPQGATLSNVYLALVQKLPVLANRVIKQDGSSLLSGYACNVNGLDFVRTSTATVTSGDKIFILSADAGG
jgi:molybdopterin-guanine dinucleotide biosynthesis protein A/molybdopterin converting factor small subunit